MDIREERQKGEFEPDLIKLINKLNLYEGSKIDLKGSYLYKSQKYFSDYDFLSKIHKYKIDVGNVIDRFNHFIDVFNQSRDVYFIELKFQTKDGEKLRFYPKQKLNAKQIKDIWDQVEFIKLDLIINIDNIFYETSIIYTFDKIDKEKLIKGLREEINELKKESKYYKVLKRYFSLLNITKPNDARIGALLKYFNSGYGQLYRNKSNLETIKLLGEYYNDKDTKERIKINIKDIGLSKYIKSKKDLDNMIKKYQGILNEASEKVYSELDL